LLLRAADPQIVASRRFRACATGSTPIAKVASAKTVGSRGPSAGLRLRRDPLRRRRMAPGLLT
jgi:hypothetical protein